VSGLLAVLIALLPTVIAFRRGHDRRIEISLVNLIVGWTGVGWLVALVWATRKHPDASLPLTLGAQARGARYRKYPE
jgi:hypothetical protein